MLTTNEANVMLLASDFRAMLADIDRSLMTTLKTAGMLPEVNFGTGLPAAQSQKLYQRMSGAISKMVEGRGEVVSTVAHLQVLHRHSNCAEVATGCGEGWEDFVAKAAADPASATA